MVICYQANVVIAHTVELRRGYGNHVIFTVTGGKGRVLIGHKAFPVPVLFSHLGVMASSGSFAHAERPSASCCTALDS